MRASSDITATSSWRDELKWLDLPEESDPQDAPSQKRACSSSERLLPYDSSPLTPPTSLSTTPCAFLESMKSEKSKRATASHHWHLAEDDLGVAVTDLEYAVMRTYESFVRWQAECLAAVTGAVLTGQENALLHVIRMHDQPKTIKDLLHLTNRQDVPNVQYGLRKLLKLGFIEKQGSGRAGVYYEATAEGAKVCDDYAKLRKKLLLEGAKRYPGFRQHSHSAGAHLELLERLYESVTREAATFHRRG